MNSLFAMLYLMYIALTVLQVAVLFINDFTHDRVSWWTVLYPTILSAFVVFFNWEFSLLVRLYEHPGEMAIVWLVFFILAIFTYCGYAYYPRMRRNPFWKSTYGWGY